MAAICTALNISDEQKCTAAATTIDGFCRFHSKQCHGLYIGYKRRNAQLDALASSPPPYLTKAKLQTVQFRDITDVAILEELHSYLFKRYALLERVIRARKLHHERFFSLNMDYGHKAWLDKLLNDRLHTLRALERLEKRTAEVLYQEQKWFKWVRQEQQNEEEARENEAKRIRREADLFRRHWKQLQGALKAKKLREEKKREEAFLEKAFRERLEASATEAEDDDAEWDPIEDELEEDKEKFIGLLKHLLWISRAPNGDHEQESAASNGETTAAAPTAPAAPAKPMNRNQKKRAKKQAKGLAAPAQSTNKPGEDADDGRVTRINMTETADEVRQRLLQGEEFEETEGMSKLYSRGTINNPYETTNKVLGLPPDEVDQLVNDIREIKQLLFCRLLISHATLLPAAMKASSLEEFLADPEVTPGELRDFSLRCEQPTLQEVRDACADFARTDEESDDDPQDASDEDDEQEMANKLNDKIEKRRASLGWGGRLVRWQAKHEQKLNDDKKLPLFHMEGKTNIDFGFVDDKGSFHNKKIRIKVCGKSIWNYPSQSAMARGGWLHFSILAKGTRLGEAVQVCRNWDEFWHLNILAIYGYFPSASWRQWAGDSVREQLLQLGFIPKVFFRHAHELTIRKQGGGHGHGGRMHEVKELRNFIVGHIKRNDPVSRRFVQYLTLKAADICVLVRDAKTGRILVSPPEEECWLIREKAGMGRASRSKWNIISQVDEKLFEQVDDMMYARFRFGFNEHYEIIAWDVEAGLDPTGLGDIISAALTKAYRFTSIRDFYEPARPVLEQLHREPATARCRDLRPGELSIWEHLKSKPDSDFQHTMYMKEKTGNWVEREVTAQDKFDYFYNDLDALEDEVLFPEEKEGKLVTAITSHSDRIIRELEESGPRMVRFIHNLDTDDDSDEYTEETFQMMKESGKNKEGKSKTIKEKKANKGLKKVEEGKKPKATSGSRAMALRNKNAQFNQQKANRSGTGDPMGAKLLEELAAGRNGQVDWQSEDAVCPNDFADDCTCRVCERVDLKRSLRLAFGLEPDVDGEIDQLDSDDGDDEWLSEESLNNESYDDDDFDEDGVDGGGANILDVNRVAKDQREYKQLSNFLAARINPSDVAREFAIFVDREKAKAFKPQWHAADFEPGAQERYAEVQQLMHESALVNSKASYIRGRWIQVLFRLGVHMDEHRLVLSDMIDVFALVGLFFPHKQQDKDEDTEPAIREFRKSLPTRTKLVSNEYKSTSLPAYYRTWRSNSQLPQTLFPSSRRPSHETRRKWETAVRPAIAHLYKAGIIAPFYSHLVPGSAFSAPDPCTQSPSLFIDYRGTNYDHGMPHPRLVDLLATARAHAAEHATARFALLRVYSHPQFWPLQMGFEMRPMFAFSDPQARSWQWKFYPKDVDGVDGDMQRVVEGRLARFRAGGQLPKEKVVVRRDIVLVLGRDRDELEELLLGTVFAIHGVPWRLEFDFWRSFVDVGVEFLEGLERDWLD